ncbi:MAG: DHH family phosphoesterase [Planctomycetota bacterium]|nr:DHH family phosphoesterase [Planctomycetota bacterium]
MSRAVEHPWDEPGFTYESNATAEEIAARLQAAGSVLILTHHKPDGDALGTSLALHRGLRQRGVASVVVLSGPIDPNLLTMVDDRDRIERIEEIGSLESRPDPDLVAVVDTGAWTQLETVGPWLRSRRDRTVGIDHHARGGSVAGLRVVDTSCASATQALVPVLDALGVDLNTDRIAEALLLGLATDTGWFRFSSAGPEVYRLAARLMESGADKDAIYARVEQNASPARFAMLARALGSLSFADRGAMAVMRLGLEDFAETGANLEELAGIVNEPLEIGSVRGSVLLTEAEAGKTKLSFRSKPDTDGRGFIDVNELAARFGGGGHVHAAGARIELELDAAVERLLSEFDRSS